MNNIIAAVDFSEASFNAVSYAAYLCNAFNSKLIVVHAYSGTEAIDDIPLTEIYDSSGDLEEANQKFLKSQMDALVRKFTIKISGVIKKGKPTNVICQVAQEEGASFIVMGMKGKGKSNSVFGSNTTAMIGKTQLPLIVVPENATYQPIENIAVAIDFKDKVPASKYPVLNQLIKKYDPFLQILNVQKKGSNLSPQFVADKIRSGLMWDKYNHSFNIISDDDVQKGINNFLKKTPVDMLAMVAKKHRLLERVFQKSYTRAMSRQTKIPLLIMHESK